MARHEPRKSRVWALSHNIMGSSGQDWLMFVLSHPVERSGRVQEIHSIWALRLRGWTRIRCLARCSNLPNWQDTCMSPSQISVAQTSVRIRRTQQVISLTHGETTFAPKEDICFRQTTSKSPFHGGTAPSQLKKSLCCLFPSDSPKPNRQYIQPGNGH